LDLDVRDVRADLLLLRDRRFALLFVARTIAVLGSAFAPVALAFGVLGLPGATATTLSIVLTAEAVPTIVFMLAGGVLADRLPRYRVLMAGDLLCTIAFLSIGVMLFTGWAPVPALAAAAVFGGTAIALVYPALTGIIPEVVAPERLQAANALIQLGSNAARIAGYALGGIAVVLVGGGLALMISAALFAVAAVLVAMLRLAPAAGKGTGYEPASSAFADLRDGWREFSSRQWLWVVVLQFSFMVAAIQAAHGVLGPVVAKESLGGAGAWSAILVGEAVGTVAGVVVAIRIRPSRPILLGTLLMFPSTLMYLLLGLAAPLWTIVVSSAILGICFDIYGVLWMTTVQRVVPAEALSRVFAYDALGSFMFGPIGLLLAGPAAAAFGARPTLLACAGVMVVATLAALLSPDVRRMRAPEAEPVNERVSATTHPVPVAPGINAP
jgi:predicted MFS family arabinose efflux permease